MAPSRARGQEHHAEDDVGHLADGGVGQPFFQGVPRRARAEPINTVISDRTSTAAGPRCQSRKDPAVQVVDHPEEGQHAHLVMTPDSTAEAGAGATGCAMGSQAWRGTSRPCSQSPLPSPKNPPAAAPGPPRQRQIQHAAGCKQVCGAVTLKDKQPQQAHARAGHRKGQIALGRVKGLPGPDVEHQGDGAQGHHLIKQIQGDQVARKAHPPSGPPGSAGRNRAEKPPRWPSWFMYSKAKRPPRTRSAQISSANSRPRASALQHEAHTPARVRRTAALRHADPRATSGSWTVRRRKMPERRSRVWMPSPRARPAQGTEWAAAASFPHRLTSSIDAVISSSKQGQPLLDQLPDGPEGGPQQQIARQKAG